MINILFIPLDWTNIESEGYVRIVQALRLHKNLKSLKLLCKIICLLKKN